MIRYLSAILLLTAFAAQSFSGAFIRLGYAINPDVFAKYCVNKAKPKLHCNGKCQVMKKIKEEEKKEQESQERKWDNKVTVLSSKSFFCQPAFNVVPFVKPVPTESFSILKDISLSIFRPPRV